MRIHLTTPRSFYRFEDRERKIQEEGFGMWFDVLSWIDGLSFVAWMASICALSSGKCWATWAFKRALYSCALKEKKIEWLSMDCFNHETSSDEWWWWCRINWHWRWRGYHWYTCSHVRLFPQMTWANDLDLFLDLHGWTKENTGGQQFKSRGQSSILSETGVQSKNDEKVSLSLLDDFDRYWNFWGHCSIQVV